jgi:hypothetical protein
MHRVRFGNEVEYCGLKRSWAFLGVIRDNTVSHAIEIYFYHLQIVNRT